VDKRGERMLKLKVKEFVAKNPQLFNKFN